MRHLLGTRKYWDEIWDKRSGCSQECQRRTPSQLLQMFSRKGAKYLIARCLPFEDGDTGLTVEDDMLKRSSVPTVISKGAEKMSNTLESGLCLPQNLLSL